MNQVVIFLQISGRGHAGGFGRIRTMILEKSRYITIAAVGFSHEKADEPELF